MPADTSPSSSSADRPRALRTEEYRRAAAEILTALHVAKEELARELEANLEQLKKVLEETHRIQRQMESVLREARSTPSFGGDSRAGQKEGQGQDDGRQQCPQEQSPQGQAPPAQVQHGQAQHAQNAQGPDPQAQGRDHQARGQDPQQGGEWNRQGQNQHGQSQSQQAQSPHGQSPQGQEQQGQSPRPQDRQGQDRQSFNPRSGSQPGQGQPYIWPSWEQSAGTHPASTCPPGAQPIPSWDQIAAALVPDMPPWEPPEPPAGTRTWNPRPWQPPIGEQPPSRP